jgi:hypothetical protein
MGNANVKSLSNMQSRFTSCSGQSYTSFLVGIPQFGNTFSTFFFFEGARRAVGYTHVGFTHVGYTHVGYTHVGLLFRLCLFVPIVAHWHMMFNGTFICCQYGVCQRKSLSNVVNRLNKVVLHHLMA